MNTEDPSSGPTSKCSQALPDRAAFLAALALLFLTIQTRADLREGLVAYYPLNGNANDASGRGHNGTATAGVRWESGVLGQAAYFGGRDAIQIPNHTDFRLLATDNKTLVFWCKGTEVDTQAVLFTRRLNGVSGICVLYYFGKIMIDLAPSVEGHWAQYALHSQVTAGWSCVALVKQGTDWRVFQNGQELTRVATYGWPWNGDPEYPGDYVFLGYDGHEGNVNFTGGMDELRIYSRALSPSEVMALYENPSGQPVVSQPISQSSCVGQTAAFAVTASGAEPLTYQWHFNGAVLEGQTASILALTNLRHDQAGTYRVKVTDKYGASTTSGPATLIVGDACVDLAMYAGMNISGEAGRTYELRYTTDLSNTDLATWTPLATNVMSNSGWFYVDRESPSSPRRFYAVRLQP